MKTFCIPDINDNTLIHKASFVNIRKLHDKEKLEIVKKAPLLSFKTCYPHLMERQNVKLCLNIFDISNSIALNYFKDDENFRNVSGTIYFINLIVKLWSIVNVKTKFYGEHKILDDAKPIFSFDDERISFFKSFVNMLNTWKTNNDINKTGFLTRDTFIALHHTISAYIDLISYLLNDHKMTYILLDKFQTES